MGFVIQNNLVLEPGHRVYGSGSADDIVIQPSGRLFLRSTGEELPLDVEEIRRKHRIDPHPEVGLHIVSHITQTKLQQHSAVIRKLTDTVKATFMEKIENGLDLSGIDLEDKIEETVNRMIAQLGGEEVEPSSNSKKSKKNGKKNKNEPPDTMGDLDGEEFEVEE